MKKMIDAQWGSLVYHGEWFQPLKADLDAFIASTQQVVQGTWTISLYKGNIEIVNRESAAMLFKPEIRSIAGHRLQPATLPVRPPRSAACRSRSSPCAIGC